MYLNKAADIVAKANAIVQKTGSRDAEKIASQLFCPVIFLNKRVFIRLLRETVSFL